MVGHRSRHIRQMEVVLIHAQVVMVQVRQVVTRDTKFLREVAHYAVTCKVVY
jgi:hypothetical protein